MYASSAGKRFGVLPFLVALLPAGIGDLLRPTEELLLFALDAVDRPLRDEDGGRPLPPLSSLCGLASFLRLPLSEDLAGEDALFPMLTCGMLCFRLRAGCACGVAAGGWWFFCSRLNTGFQPSWEAIKLYSYVRPGVRTNYYYHFTKIYERDAPLSRQIRA